jgi:hypothetical protein
MRDRDKNGHRYKRRRVLREENRILEKDTP